MRIKILWVFICTFLVVAIPLLSENAIILKQDDAPLKIAEYTTKYGTYERSKVIAHSSKVLNSSDKTIVAYRIGFISFTVFNEFLHKFTGFTVATVASGKEDKGMWTDRYSRGFLFQNYGTGIAYVDAVRFEDGSIWKANEADILPQIQEIEESFTADLLKEKVEK